MLSSIGTLSVIGASCCFHINEEVGSVEDALSMADEERAAHIRSCNPLLMADHDCPLCEAIVFIDDVELCPLAETRNMPIRRGDRNYARQERMTNTETMLRRRHAANLIAKHAAHGTLEILADRVVKAHGGEEAIAEEGGYYALMRHNITAAAKDAGSYAEAVSAIADAMLFRSVNTSVRCNAVPSFLLCSVHDAQIAGLFTPASRTVLNMLVLQALLPIIEARIKAAGDGLDREGFLPSALAMKQARWILVLAVLCAPRAPQCLPVCGSYSDRAIAVRGMKRE